MPSFKQKVAEAFSDNLSSYHEEALIQKQVCRSLFGRLPALPAGPILELGCGTGFLSELLLTLPHPVELTDVSLSALDYCGAHFSAPVRFLDAETLSCKNRYSLITATNVIQWFEDLEGTSQRLYEALVPGGYLAFAYFSSNTWVEWRELAEHLGLHFTGNTLPDSSYYKTLFPQATVDVEAIKQLYPSATGFFSHLKRIGAAVSRSGQRLSPQDMQKLQLAWQNLELTYECTYAMVRKP